jgi:hypothetical protein
MPDRTSWRALRPDRAQSLTDARLQLHHALQFGTALGISYVEARPDDSHTNHGWDHDLNALVSRAARGSHGDVAIATRPADLTTLVLVDGAAAHAIPLHGLTIATATERITAALAAEGLDPARYTLRRHFEIPSHAIDSGGTFDTSDSLALSELGTWYSNAAHILGDLVADTPGAAELRTWPHHFDIATLVTVRPGRTTGAGLVPGDNYYDEPYFYVNAYPAPSADRLTAPLEGDGTWHTHEWTGAVLPGSRLAGDAAAQATQANAFLTSALAASRALLD